MAVMGIESHMTITVLSIVCVLNLLLGTLVFVQARYSLVNQLFLAMNCAMALWVTTNIVFMITAGDVQFMAALLSYGAAAWLTISFVKFCNEIAPKKLDRQTMQMITVATVLVGAASVMPGFIATGVEGGEIQTQPVPLLIYGLAIVSGLFIGNSILMYAAKHAPKRQRPQYIVLIFGLAVGAIIGVICNLLLPMMGIYSFVAYGPVGLLVFVGACIYAVAKHGLFDVRFATVRAIGYTGTVASLGLVYFLIAYVISEFLLDKVASDLDLTAPINVLIALTLAVMFQPIKSFFDKLTDKFFYHSQYNTDQFITDLGEALTSTINLRLMLDKAATVMTRALSASSISFVVYRENKTDMLISGGRKATFDKKDLQELKQLLHEVEDPVVDVMEAASYSDSKAVRRLAKKRYSLLLPLGSELGFVLIRERLGGAYSDRDKRVLSAVSDQLTIAIQNARSVQELRELNASLQQHIDEATKELRRSNTQLKKLDETKDEFVSMASHQLRTPLTSVKGYISMILEGDVGKISKQQELLLHEAFMSSERMVRLIGDFLNVSRLQTGKFMIDAKTRDLSQIVKEEVESMKLIAHSHDQNIEYHAPDGVLDVVVDEDKTRQVIMNLIDNAIYYSPSGTDITIRLHASKGQAIFEVHDRGIGVPKEKQDQLFTKFFRAENARKQRPDGTGIGLYLANKVVESQGGEIIFHSREGMGSVFGFKLPLKK